MSGDEYLVRGATLKCSMGSSQSKLNLPICHGVYTKKKPLMNKLDFVPMANILPFGACKVTKGPCVPATGGPWLKAHDATMITNAASITMDSFLVCTIGGMIEPTKSGQE